MTLAEQLTAALKVLQNVESATKGSRTTDPVEVLMEGLGESKKRARGILWENLKAMGLCGRRRGGYWVSESVTNVTDEMVNELFGSK